MRHLVEADPELVAQRLQYCPFVLDAGKDVLDTKGFRPFRNRPGYPGEMMTIWIPESMALLMPTPSLTLYFRDMRPSL